MLDVKTLSFLIMIASVLYAITIAFFATQANQYQGVKFYMCGAIFAAFGFLFLAAYVFNPKPIIRATFNDFFYISSYFYCLGIAKFLDFKFKPIYLSYFSIFVIIHADIVIFTNEANSIINAFILPFYISAFYIVMSCFLWQRRHVSFASSIYFILCSILIMTFILLTRCYMVIAYQIDAVLQYKSFNIFYLLAIFITAYFRNVGFIMMVSQRLYQDLRKTALEDFLTKVRNRRATQEKLNEHFDLFKRYQHPCSLLLLDIDYFKSVNDNYGHEVGDKILQKIADTLKTHLRKTDILGRWGGEEFLIILPDTTIIKALDVAEKLRHEVANTKIEKLFCTISLGVDQLDKDDNIVSQAIKRADDALYKAKSSGRNCVMTIRII